MAKQEENKCCGNCFWFDNEDAYGQGWCIDEQCETSCGSICGNHSTNKRMEINYRDYYPQSVYKHPEPMEMMIPTPKDFGQYLQNKRNRRRKK